MQVVRGMLVFVLHVASELLRRRDLPPFNLTAARQSAPIMRCDARIANLRAVISNLYQLSPFEKVLIPNSVSTRGRL